MNRVEMRQPAKRCAAILGRLLTAEVRCNHSFGYLGVIGDDMPIRIYILAKQLNRPTATLPRGPRPGAAAIIVAKR